MNLSNNEQLLIKAFLQAYREMLNNEANIPFNPRSLVIISQPDIRDEKLFHRIAYNKWFDELDVEVSCGSNKTLLEAFVETPLEILMDAEELGMPLISKKDQKKLLKVLKLLGEIKIERQL